MEINAAKAGAASPDRNSQEGIMETPTKTKLLTALKTSTHVEEPFDYWLLEDVLPARMCDAIATLPFAAPTGAVFDGRREANNSTRVYFSPENQAQYALMQD